MKNKLMSIIIALIITMLLIPNTAYAKGTSTSLEEAKQEEIKIFGEEESYKESVEKLKNTDLSSYKTNSKKVNVYVFRGNSCGHCFDAVVYFTSIVEDYGKYFNFISYEVWADQDNAELMEAVAKKLGDKASGVPYIVIGKKSWSGFADSMDSEIKEAIKSEYDKKAEDRYDVVKLVDGKDSNSNDVVALIIIILVTGAIVFGIIKTRKSAS